MAKFGAVLSSADATPRNSVQLTGIVTVQDSTPNTLADVTGLSFAVTNGVTYRFYIFIPFTSGAATNGSRWTINTPNTSLLIYRSLYTATTTTQTTNFLSAKQLPAACNASALTGGNVAVIEGIITPSADGTVQVQFANEEASTAITALAGAYLEWW